MLENQLLKDLHQKRIGFSPLVFCEFFQGMDVLQLQSVKTKEYIFALYFSGKLIGHVYLGNLYDDARIKKIKDKYFPPTWKEIQKYVNTTSAVWYCKFDRSQYAFVLENILQKIE